MELRVVLGKHEVMCEFAGEPKLAALHTAVHKTLCELDQGTFPTFRMTMMPEGLLLSDDSSVAALSSGSTIEVVPILDAEGARRILKEKGVKESCYDNSFDEIFPDFNQAVERGDTETVRLIILAWGSRTFDWSTTPVPRALYAALAEPDLPMCRILLASSHWKKHLAYLIPSGESDALQSRDLVQILIECGVTEFSNQFFYRAAEKGRDWVFAAFMPQDREVLRISLHKAVEANSLPVVRIIVSHGTLQQSSFTDALVYAARDPSPDRTDVRRLLVELSVQDGDGGTYLMQAASAKNVAACEEILAYLKANNRTANVALKDSKGWTCLMHAVSGTGYTSHTPSQPGRRDFTSVTLDNQTPTTNGSSLKPEEADKLSAQLVVLLTSHGASVGNYDGLTALLIAVTRRHCGETVTALLAAGADPSAHNNDGPTALHMAVTVKSYDDAVAALLAAGACPKVCERGGVPLLHDVLTKNAFMFEALMASPRLDLNVRDSYGRTVLMRMARSNRIARCRALLEKGADVGAQDNDGWTCLGHAAASGDVKVVTLLLDHGAGVNDGLSPPLLAAVLAASAPVCHLLLERGADVTKPAADGRTCVSVAAGLKGRGAKAVQALVHEALDGGDGDGAEPEAEAETAQGAVGETPGSGSSKRKREDDEEDPAGSTHACAVCGAVALASGEPFPSAESVLRHASSKHRMRRSEYTRRFGEE